MLEPAMEQSQQELLELHHDLVATPSVSGNEDAVADLAGSWLRARGFQVERFERNCIAWWGELGPESLLLNSHLDTVPPGAGWTRDPHRVERDGDRIYGLGSNDAKAAVATMMSAAAQAAAAGQAKGLVLTLVADEETGGRGTEIVLPRLGERGFDCRAAVVGEPTGLDIANAQKGLMILDLVHEGDPRHAAHPGDDDAILGLARDLLALGAIDHGSPHPDLGLTRVTPTVVRAGEAKNRVPGEARALLDVRSVPGPGHASIAARLEAALEGRIEIRSSRLEAVATPEHTALVKFARSCRPASRVYGSPTMSDMVFLADRPVIKCGPGSSLRSHTADEFVLESELVEGLNFYLDLIVGYANGEAQ